MKLANDQILDEQLEQKICDKLRNEYSPRHVPDKIIQVESIPYTLTRKKMEIPVRNILMGVPVKKAADVDAMANPDSLDFFTAYDREQDDYSRNN